MESNRNNDALVSSVEFSDVERDSGTFDEGKLLKAIELLDEHGFVRMVNVFDSNKLSEIDTHFRRRYRTYLHSTNETYSRPLFPIDVEGPFNNPNYFAHPLVMPLIRTLLGDKCIVGKFGSVVSFPGAPDQYTHRDSPQLFGEDYSIVKDIPPYQFTVLIPLIDCNLKTGCTKVWPGSHRYERDEDVLNKAALDPEVQRGSILIMDSRLIHRGGPNVSDLVRPLVYITYQCSWYRDFRGYTDRNPLNITNKELKKIPEAYKHMFGWTRDPYDSIKYRIKHLLKRLLPGRAVQLVRFVRRQG